MNITVVAVGTRGDVEPHAALCRGLLRAGYRATLCAPADFADTAYALRIPFHPIPVYFRELLGTPEGGSLLASDANGFRFLRELHSVAGKFAGQVISAIREACRDADAVCHSPLGLPARFFARERGIPAIATFLQPLAFTRERPTPLLTLPVSTPRAINSATHRLVEELFWQAVRPLLQRHLAETLPRHGYFAEMRQSGSPMLLAYSPSLVPAPGDWTPAMRVTGYWTLPHDAAWRPPQSLVDFLAAGPPPVCIGFGSMNGSRTDAMLSAALRVLGRSGRRAIALTGWSGGLHHSTAGDNLYIAESAPHDWLFPRVSAVIHHGGAGTTAAALRAGVASVILPFFFDQTFWGRTLHARGLGPAPIPPRRLTDAALLHTIETAETSVSIRSRVKELGRRLAREDGIGNAVAAIEEILHCPAGMARKTG